MNKEKSKSLVSLSSPLLLGIAFGIFYWFLDAAVDVYLLGDESFLSAVFSPGIEQIWLRVFIICLMVIFFMIARFINNKRKSAENALIESEERFRSLIIGSSDGIIIHNGKRIIEANQKLADLLGYELHEIVGKSPWDFLDEESQKRITENIQGEDNTLFQVTAIRKNGNKVTFEYINRIIPYYGETVWITTVSDCSAPAIESEGTREDSDHYHQLLQNSNDPLFVYGLTNENSPDLFLEASEMARIKFGYSFDEYEKLSIMEIIVPEERDNILPVFQTLIDFKHSIFETEILTKDKDRVPVEISSHLFDLDSRPMIISTLREITERKKANQLLHDSEKQYRQLFSNAPVAYLSLDPDGNIIEVNDKWCDLFGYSKEETLDSWFGDFLTRSSLDRFRASFADLNESKEQMEIDLEVSNKDKTISNIFLIARTAQNSFGDIQSAQCILLDNSRQKGGINEKHRQKQWLEQIIDNATDVIFSFKPDSTITNVNPAFEKVMGNPAESFIDSKFDTIIHPDDLDFIHQAIDKCIEGEKIPAIEIRLQTKSKEYIPTELTLTSFGQDGKVVGINCIAKDLTRLWPRSKSEKDILEEYQKQTETLLDYACILDKNLKVVYTNKNHRKLSEKLGFKADIVGHNVVDCYPFESDESRSIYSDVFDKATTVVREISYSTENAQFIFETKMVPIYAGDEISFALFIIKDVSSHRQAEATLKKSEAELSLIFNNASAILVLVDNERKIRRINNSGLEFADRSEEDILGKRGGEALGCLHHPDDPKGCGFGPNCEKCPVRNTVFKTFKTGINHHHIPAKLPFEIDGERKDLDLLVSTTVLDSKDEKLVLVTIENITEQKVIEESLLRSELSYQTLTENLPGLVYRVHCRQNNKMQFFNNLFESLTGYLEDELGKGEICSIEPLIHEEDRPNVVSAVKEAIKENRSFEVEYRLNHKNGDIKYFIERGQPVFDSDGKLISIDGVIFDITDRKQAEEALQNLSARNKAILEAVPDIIMEVDSDKVYTWVNKAGYEFFGEDVIGKEASFYFDGEQDTYEIVKPLFEGDENIIYVESWQRRKDGEKRLLAWWCRVLKDDDGNVIGALSTARDITEIKIAEEKLRESEEKFRAVFETAEDSIFIKDCELKYIQINPNMEKLFNLPASELFGKTDNDIFGPEAGKHIREVDMRVLEGEIIEDEHTIPIDGKPHTFNTIKVPMRNAEGKIIGLCGIARDITDRKQAENALRALEERFHDIALSSADWIWETDADGVYTFASGRVKQILGYEPAELIGRTPFELMPQDEAKRIGEIFNEIVLEKKPIVDLENWNLTKEGKSICLLTNGVPILDRQGNLVGYRGVDKDITDRKQTEEALQESEAKFRSIVELSADGISLIDKDCKIIEWNLGLENITGLKREDVLGKPIYDIQYQLVTEEHKNDQHYQMMKSSMQGIVKDGQSPYLNEFMETEIVRPDGTHRTVEILSFPIKSENGFMMCGITRDITDKRLLEEELNKAEKLESIGVLAGGIAHDFNNILTAILGNISLAKMDTVPESDMNARLIDAEKASERAQNLTRQLLTFSKGGAPIKQTISIRNLIKESTGFALHGSNVKALYNIPDDLRAIDADTGQISQVINNLIINANQAMPDGGTINIAAKNVDIKQSDPLPLKEGQYVRIIISDEGTGIPEDHLNRIFDPYFTTKQRGSGLGLATTYSIIKNHDGHIDVESKQGERTSFTIYLPVSDKPEEIEIEEDDIKAVGGGKILVMDDEDAIRMVTGVALTKAGYKVDFAVNGEEAVEKYKSSFEEGHPFDLIFMDLTIPGGMGGQETLEKIKEINPNVKAIASSGYSNNPIMSDHEKYGFCGVINKPYKAEDINRIVYQILHGDKVPV